MPEKTSTNQSHFSRGFSLTELLVVIVILGILVTVIWAGFSNYAARQENEAEIDDIFLSLREARTDTVAGAGGTEHGFHVASGAITTFASSTYDVSDSSNIVITLAKNTATHSFTGGVDYISFAKISGIPSATGTIDLYNAKLNSTTTLTIYDSGLIE